MKYGYEHWSHKPLTPGIHELYLVPQSVGDCWEGYCSCGEWVERSSFWDFDKKEDLLNDLRQKFEVHKNSA